MATKKSTKKQGSKKQPSKSGSGKKAASKKPGSTTRRRDTLQIPPVIVGGGSLYVWLRNDIYDQIVVNPPAPPGPYSAGMFDCFKIERNAFRVDVHDGQNQKDPVPVADHRRHRTVFRMT